MNEPHKLIALSPVRKVIAARMVDSTRTIPHFRLTAEIDVDELIKMRRQLRATPSEINLSLNDLLVKGCALALMDVPAVNIQWTDQGIVQYATADISVVIQVGDGLSTPIIRGAERKSVWEISREIKELAARAATQSLKMNDVFGGSFSISNLGMHGVDQFDAVINPPQCAILAIGSAKPRMILSQAGESRPSTTINATLSVDHRAIYGAAGAQFLAALRNRLEHPASLISDDHGG